MSTMTSEDMRTLMRRLDAIDAHLADISRRQSRTDELLAEMSPIAKAVMATATEKLDVLDKRGYFTFGKEFVAIADRIVTGFSPDDVRQLADAVVGILRTVRAVTQPKVLEVADEAAAVLEHADKAEPLGLLGMVRATRDDDVQKGMAVMMEMMRHVGRAAQVISAERKASPQAVQKEKLAAVLGPRRKTALGTERAPAPCAVPSKGPQPVAAVIDGVAFGADGHLADPATWTPDLAGRLAAASGVTLDEPRWAVVRFARVEFESTRTSPNIRRLTQGTGLATKDLYTLFPKAPARTVAKIAGIPKPAGCI
jgi:tRNA 2-thiouridine synthesizing protein E